MARKNVIPSFKMLDSVSISTDQTSSTTNVTNLDRATIVLEWTGTSPVGVVTVEAQKKEIQNAIADTSWIELDFGTTIAISGNTGNHVLILDNLDFTDIRVQYVATSGMGSLTATLTAKQIGG
jgi:hypothetical protein